MRKTTKSKKMMNDIIILEKENDLVEQINKIDLSRDVVFSLPEEAKEKIYINFSGSIQVTLGNDFNLSMTQNKYDGSSPFRTWKTLTKLKFCFPRGVVPLFKQPTNNKSIVSTNVSYDSFVDVKIIPNKFLKEKIQSQYSVIYQNLSIETTTNKVILSEEFPTLIIPMGTVLFEILPMITYLVESSYCGNLYLIRNNEFYYHFKESL